jgi:hypothetical protein
VRSTSTMSVKVPPVSMPMRNREAVVSVMAYFVPHEAK